MTGHPPALRLLVVDDNDDILQMLTLAFTDRGHTVVSAGTVRSALLQAQQHSVDLVVSDWSFPDGTGGDLMYKLNQKHGLKGVLLTAFSESQLGPHWRKAGFVRLIEKFSSLQAITSAVEEAAHAPASAE